MAPLLLSQIVPGTLFLPNRSHVNFWLLAFQKKIWEHCPQARSSCLQSSFSFCFFFFSHLSPNGFPLVKVMGDFVVKH